MFSSRREPVRGAEGAGFAAAFDLEFSALADNVSATKSEAQSTRQNNCDIADPISWRIKSHRRRCYQELLVVRVKCRQLDLSFAFTLCRRAVAVLLSLYR